MPSWPQAKCWDGDSVKFILYSHFAEDAIHNHVGEPEYGYYFVLKAFRGALNRFGVGRGGAAS